MSNESWTRFGTADLSNCEREQIHLAGSIQPHGALLVLDPDSFRVLWASANLEHISGISPEHALGRRLQGLSPGTPEAIRSYEASALGTLPHAVPVSFDANEANGRKLVGHVHESPDGQLVLEVEPEVPESLDRERISRRLEELLHHGSLDALFRDSTELIREITGYDRVMVYRFDPEGHGEIVAEAKEGSLESFLGNHYPASDIPRIARKLYVRNRTRTLMDVEYEPVPLLGDDRMDPAELDMSLCQLRSMSPIHLQYLQNMGVSATLVASLVIDDELWGLVACHHYAPKRPSHAIRAACELIAEVMSTRILAIESAAQASVEFVVRRLEQRMVETIGRRGEWIPALMEGDDALLDCVAAKGAALIHEGRVHTIGDVPSTADLRSIAGWISEQEFHHVFDTHRLGRKPRFRHLASQAAGVLATRISRLPGELLFWVRPEQVRMVTWGGDPNKPVELDSEDPSHLSPRRSFEAWHQLVEKTSTSWTKANRAAARAVGASITDVILQFRSVRLLLAHRQIAEARGQIEAAEAPLFIADGTGRCLVANAALGELLGGRDVGTAVDLVEQLVDPPGLRRTLEDSRAEGRSWRGRVEIELPGGERRPALLRADPIFDRQHGLIGTVFLFIDLSGKQEMESARRRFQRAIVDRRSRFRRRVVTRDEANRQLFERILDNANVAALEVVAGFDVDVVPDLLRSIEVSVRRASDLLEEIARKGEE